jgi:TP901 family phage tail tape measure protein
VVAVVDVLARVRADISQFTASMTAAQSQAKSMGDSMGAAGKKVTTAGSTMSKKATVPILAFGTGIAMASAKFEAGMNKVAAITNTHGPEMQSQFESMRDKAKELGATTQFSATEAADAMAFLGMAGFKTDEIISAMPGTLALAAAGNLDLASTADIVSNVLTGFGQEAGESARLADVMAKAVTSSNTDIRQLGAAMAYVAPVANAAGATIEETTAAVGMLSDAGIQGSMAGTTLRGIIAALVQPASKATVLLNKMGVSVVDSTGEMKPLADIFEELGKTGVDVGQIMNAFGLRAGPGVAALLEQGSDKMRDQTAALMEAGGTAQTMADVQLKGLTGAMTILKSATEGLMIALGDSGLLDILTDGVTKLSEFVQQLSKGDKKMMKMALVALAVVAAIGPMVFVVGKIITVFSGLFKAFAIAIKIIKIATTVIRVLWAVLAANPFILIALAVAAIAFLIYKYWDEIVAFLKKVWSAVVQYAKDVFGPFVSWYIGIWKSIIGFIFSVWKAVFLFLVAVWEKVVAVATSIWQALFDWFVGLWNGIVTAATAIWNALLFYFGTVIGLIVLVVTTQLKVMKAIVVGIFNGIKAAALFIWRLIGDKVTAAFEAIKAAAVFVFNTLKDFFIGVFNFYKNIFVSVWTAIKNAVVKVWDVLYAAALKVFNTLGTFFAKVFAAMKLVFKTAWDLISGIVVAVWDRLYSGAVRIFDTLKAFFSKVFAAMKLVFTTAWHAIRDTVVGVWDRIKESAAAGWAFVKGKLDAMMDFVSGIKETVWAAVSGLWSTLGDGLRSMINTIIGMWNKIDFGIDLRAPDWIPGIGGKGWQVNDFIPDIPLLAKGGIVSGPTLAMIGEGRNDEAVVPLPSDWKRNGIDGFGGGTQGNETTNTYNVTVPLTQTQMTADELRRTMRQIELVHG